MMDIDIREGDALAVLQTLPDRSVRCCVTSPPYYSLRDYGVEGQIGLERTPDEYVARLVEVFREVRRVLTDDGSLWLNLGDLYSRGKIGRADDFRMRLGGKRTGMGLPQGREAPSGIKEKDQLGIPWMVAFALRADGWYLRRDIVWSKPNCMPESVLDRPTASHEFVFLLAKSLRYHFDGAAIAEPCAESSVARIEQFTFGGAKDYRNTEINPNRSVRKALENFRTRHLHGKQMAIAEASVGSGRRRAAGFNERWDESEAGGKTRPTRNARSVWTIATTPYKGAHFAVMPLELAERCVLAGSAEKDLVLDPFAGAGTVGVACKFNGRRFLGIELNPANVKLASERIQTAVLTEAGIKVSDPNQEDMFTQGALEI